MCWLYRTMRSGPTIAGDGFGGRYSENCNKGTMTNSSTNR